MVTEPNIAEIAALIGDPARSNMLLALMGGQALTANELALIGGVAPSTASGHLAKMVASRLLTVTNQGRHRYFRLASANVGRLLETLSIVAGDSPPRHRPRSVRDEAVAAARTCYDHLAGRLGVAIADALVSDGHVQFSPNGGGLTCAGVDFLSGLGVDLPQTNMRRKAFCRPCLDWSERRFHIGGGLGRAIADFTFRNGWLVRHRESRAVIVTEAGAEALSLHFRIEPASV